MTKVFLAAGVALVAISAPAAAKPDRDGARADRSAQRVDRSAQRVDRSAQRVERQQFRVERAPRMEQRAQRREVRAERAPRFERQQVRAERFERAPRVERMTQRTERQAQRQQVRVERAPRIERQQQRAERSVRVHDRAIARNADRAVRVQDRAVARQADRTVRVQDRAFARQEMRDQRIDQRMARQDLRADRIDQRFVTNRFAFARGGRVLAPAQAQILVGAPVTTAASMMTLSALPSTVSYLYPDTNDYYYRYGDGYAYRVDRSSNLISALIPLLLGGFMPGQYLPNNYMNSYVPASYGFNSFYQDSPYQCNRYVNGIIYQVDCVTGMIEDVVPLYAGGYGVGQMLPSTYYNLPYEYRGLYEDDDDYGYYYAPGAIYQYDQRSSLITSVAALLSPGFGIGQQLPMGYSTYNVPYAYRDTYYDTPNSWYRYNNGNIYQIDPTTQLVTAIVASILT
jgi:hypothetical protein